MFQSNNYSNVYITEQRSITTKILRTPNLQILTYSAHVLDNVSVLSSALQNAEIQLEQLLQLQTSFNDTKKLCDQISAYCSRSALGYSLITADQAWKDTQFKQVKQAADLCTLRESTKIIIAMSETANDISTDVIQEVTQVFVNNRTWLVQQEKPALEACVIKLERLFTNFLQFPIIRDCVQDLEPINPESAPKHIAQFMQLMSTQAYQMYSASRQSRLDQAERYLVKQISRAQSELGGMYEDCAGDMMHLRNVFFKHPEIQNAEDVELILLKSVAIVDNEHSAMREMFIFSDLSFVDINFLTELELDLSTAVERFTKSFAKQIQTALKLIQKLNLVNSCILYQSVLTYQPRSEVCAKIKSKAMNVAQNHSIKLFKTTITNVLNANITSQAAKNAIHPRELMVLVKGNEQARARITEAIHLIEQTFESEEWEEELRKARCVLQMIE